MDSILTSVKKSMGISEDYEYFDADIIMHINSIFSILTQLGIGPTEGFAICDKNSVWSDFLGDNKKMESVKSYIYLKVKMLFDPPTSSSVMEASNRLISEFEWRLNASAEDGEEKSK